MSSAVPIPPPLGLDIAQRMVVQKWQEIFKSQDQEKDEFDVTFDINGKQLHAHKHMVSAHSETFKAMFSSRWSTPNVPISIANRTFNDFKTFVNYMYLIPVQLTNIMAIVDMAEYYGIQWIKDICDNWLSTQQQFSPLADFYEATKMYSMMKSKAAIFQVIHEKCFKTPLSIGSYGFSKETIMEVVTFQRAYDSEDSLFKAVYYWAKIKNRHLGISTKALYEAMKIDLADALPHIKFDRMPKPFLRDFIRPIKHVIDENIWKAIDPIFEKPQVVFQYAADPQTKLEGYLLADEKIVDFIKSLKNKGSVRYIDRSGCHWYKTCRIPSKPSQLQIKDNVDFYLCITADYRRIAVKQRSGLKDGDYLLAELYGAKDRFTSGGTISLI